MNDVYGLDAKGIELATAAEQLASDIVGRNASEVDVVGRFPREAFQALADQGFLGLCLPADVLGKGQPPAVFAAVVENLASACPSTAMIFVMHVAAARAIFESKTLVNREAILRELASGTNLTTLAFSESGSRSQFWAPISRLEPKAQSGDFVTSASKSWVTSASEAELYVTSGQKPGATSPLESTLYLVRRKNHGVRIAGSFNGLGLRGNDSAPVELVDYCISPDDLLTEQGAGAVMMLAVVLPWFCIGTAAMAHGICRAAVSATGKHLATTPLENSSTRLRDLPNLRARLAEMSSRTEQSRALLAHAAAAMLQSSEQSPLLVLQARLAAMQAAWDVTDLAMKTCGGAAFSKHLRIEQMFRDARAGWVMAPTVDHLQEFIGRTLTGLPLL